MKHDLINRKLAALLHDPANKAYILMQLKESHTDWIKKILDEVLYISLDDSAKEFAEKADHIASASDRIMMPSSQRYKAEVKIRFLEHPEIRHPLSGDLLNGVDRDKIKAFKIEQIEEITKKAYSKVRDIAKQGEDEKLYLVLWRSLRNFLEEGSNTEEQKRLWAHLPADTRIPDHNIWNHLKTTASLSTALPNPAFLLVTVDPVQPFIDTARKTKDLWMGSMLLSYLIWQAMKPVVEEYGPDSIIFPDLWGQPIVDLWLKKEKGLDVNVVDLNTPTLPNRFLAIVPHEEAGEIAEKSVRNLKEGFWEIAEKIKEDIKKRKIEWNNYLDKIWNRQIEEAFNSYFAILPWNLKDESFEIVSYGTRKKFDYSKMLGKYGLLQSVELNRVLKAFDEKGEYPVNIGNLYPLLYMFVERGLGARKSIRDLAQIEEPSYKCKLCGEREALHSGGNKESYKAIKDFWNGLKTEFSGEFKKAEMLCSVCTTKRMAYRFFKEKLGKAIDDDFPSTSEITTASFKELLIKNVESRKLEELITSIIEFLKDLRLDYKIASLPKLKKSYSGNPLLTIDGEWLMKENFDLDKLEHEYEIERKNIDESKRKEVINKLSEIEKALKSKNKKSRPPKYYALLYMDGDNMGKWLSGSTEFHPNIENVINGTAKRQIESKFPDFWKEINDKKRPLSPSLHNAISAALRDYSLYVVKHFVETRHLGKVIYAGGDDVLAFVNLNDLFSVMNRLRAAFSGEVEGSDLNTCYWKGDGWIELNGNFYLTMGGKATASMGVVIAHYEFPLQIALRAARRMEKVAKEKSGRNSFAIAFLRRSGEIREAYSKWFIDEDGGRMDVLRDAIEPVFSMIKDGSISNTFIYTLKEEKTGFGGNTPKEAFKAELKRTALRAVKTGGEKKKVEKELLEVQRRENSLLDNIFKVYMEMGSADNLLSLLEITDFIASEYVE